MYAAGNHVGEEGARELAKALDSGQCKLENLDLGSKSACLPTCAAGPKAFLPVAYTFESMPGRMLSVGSLLLADCARVCCAANHVGETGAVALVKALESGQCKLKSLDLRGTPTRLAACAVGPKVFLPGLALCVDVRC